MNFKMNGNTVFSLTPQGDITFHSFYEEENLAPRTPGWLRIAEPQGVALLACRDAAAGIIDVTLLGRFCAEAVFPPDAYLCIKEPAGTVSAALTRVGDLLVRGQDRTALPSPGVHGPYLCEPPIVYATPGLHYSPATFGTQYNMFEAPTSPDWETDTIDLSAMCGPIPVEWPFTINAIPINGLLRIPQGAGPFPLIVFAHGNHSAVENSTPGYIYLCDLLASHGIIAATIDVNFLNQLDHEVAARALVHLEHLRQFRDWNGQGGHPLAGRIDLDRIVIVGHSRGGEAVGHASLFNRMDNIVAWLPPDDGVVLLTGSPPRPLGPYHFHLRGLVAIAPTDDRYKPIKPLLPYREYSTIVNDTSYFLIHGSMDRDVWDFQGYRAYDRALPYNVHNMLQAAKGYKSLLWVYNANHNYFNTVWGYDTGQDPGANIPPGLITPGQQQNIAQVYIGAWAQVHLLARSSYWPLFRDVRTVLARNWLNTPPPPPTLISQYHDKDRLWLQTFDNVGLIELTEPVTGVVNDTNSQQIDKVYLDAGPISYAYEQTGGLAIEWNAPNQSYDVSNLNFHADINRFQVLSLRVGQSPEVPNPVSAAQDFTIRISSGGSQFSVQASVFADLPYPGALSVPPPIPVPPPITAVPDRKMVMQTIRVPLSRIAAGGVNVQAIDQIAFVFGITNQGVLYFDDLQLSL